MICDCGDTFLSHFWTHMPGQGPFYVSKTGPNRGVPTKSSLPRGCFQNFKNDALFTYFSKCTVRVKLNHRLRGAPSGAGEAGWAIRGP